MAAARWSEVVWAYADGDQGRHALQRIQRHLRLGRRLPSTDLRPEGHSLTSDVEPAGPRYADELTTAMVWEIMPSKVAGGRVDAGPAPGGPDNVRTVMGRGCQPVIATAARGSRTPVVRERRSAGSLSR